MKKYSFLLKPLFYIFNLVFACWLVFRIEKMTPSDFGRYGFLFDEGPYAPASATQLFKKKYLFKLCSDYKTGKLDSTQLDKRLDLLFSIPKSVANK